MSETFAITDDKEVPPSYSETSPPQSFPSKENNALQSIRTQREQIREKRIQTLITNTIEPLLYTNLLDGMHKRIFLLVPPDTLSDHPNLTPKSIVGLPTDTTTNNISIHHLHGSEDLEAFWQKPIVLQDLASCLRARLVEFGYKVESPNDVAETITAQPSSTQEQERPQPSPTSWFKKKPFNPLDRTSPSPSPDPTTTTNYKLGWRSEEEDLPRRRLAPDEVRVIAKLRDVSFRVETAMGLLDSVGGTVLWVEVEVGM